MKPVKELLPGDVGYVATGLKTVAECRVGDTISSTNRLAAEPLPALKESRRIAYAAVSLIFNVESLKKAYLERRRNKLRP